jgi:hypothetical protein
MNEARRYSYRLFWSFLFAASFAFVEAAVVIYLRALYYPQGFAFPLQILAPDHIPVELIRELSTLIMIAAVACLAATRPWKRFGYFIFVFGIWDIFFYLWLKLSINWPASLLDWDILFLIPLPWIGPVIAPLLVALMMTTCGLLIILRMNRGQSLRLTTASVVLFLLGTVVILYSFISDTGATLGGMEPLPYRYELLAIGLVLYGAAFFTIRTIPALPREPA